jgi:hypothetical protein
MHNNSAYVTLNPHAFPPLQRPVGDSFVTVKPRGKEVEGEADRGLEGEGVEEEEEGDEAFALIGRFENSPG